MVETAPQTGALSRVETTSAASEATSFLRAAGRGVMRQRAGLAGRPGPGLPGSAASVSPPSHRTLAALTRLGSQTGSQRRQTPGHTRPRRAMVSPARSLIRPRPATCSDGADAPEKRKVGGSTPPLTTTQLATYGPVTRPNVLCCWIYSAFLVTVAARSRPSFAVRKGTRGA